MRNRVKCLKCDDTIESKHVHDFVTCSCGNVSVDGGLDYSRRSFETMLWIDIDDEGEELHGEDDS